MRKQILFLCVFLLFNVFHTDVLANDDTVFTLKPVDDTNPTILIWDSVPNVCSILVSPQGAIELQLNQKADIVYDNIQQILSIPLDVKVEGDLSLDDSNYLEIKAGNVNQWKLFVFEDFQGVVSGWSNTAVSSCGTANNKFLGGYCNFAGTTVSKTWSNLPNHRMVKVTFNFHFIDEWTGQAGIVQLDDDYGWQQAFSWCQSVLPWYCKKFGINVCGNEYPDEISTPVEFSRIHSESSLTLNFSSTLTGDACLASWGIDDVSIYLI